MTHENFEAFGFAEPLSRALTQCGYARPTPVQGEALKPQLDGRDLLALAETGSGKTAAFLLPILQELALNPINPNPREVLALVLAPTRELALQIDQEVASLTRNMHFVRRSVVLGGVSKGPQINALKRGVHILVATPGRLLDHVDARHADLRPVRTFVLDEADRMFDMGFIRDVRKIASLLSHKRRTAMFSATMPGEIRKLAHELLNDPYRVDLSPKQVVVDRIDQKVMIVPSAQKQSRLHTLLEDSAWSRVIVFTRTKRGADRVSDRLAMAGIGAAAIHGNKAQNARQRALKDFSAGHVRVLVATDIAARGIDVSDVSHVVNFDMPVEPETYVHRIGRTARKGTSGVAVSLCDPGEKGEILAIERLMRQSIEVIPDVGGEALPALERRPHADRESEPRAHGGHDRGGRDRGNASRDRNGRGRNGRDGGPRQARGERAPYQSAPRDERAAPHHEREDGAQEHTFEAAPARTGERREGRPHEGKGHRGSAHRSHGSHERRAEGRDRPAQDGRSRGPRDQRDRRDHHSEGGRPERQDRDASRHQHGEGERHHRPARAAGEGFDPARTSERPQRTGGRDHHARSDRPRGDRPHGDRPSAERGHDRSHADRRGGENRDAANGSHAGSRGREGREGHRGARGEGRPHHGGHAPSHGPRKSDAHGPARERAENHRAHDRGEGDRSGREGGRGQSGRGQSGWNGKAPAFMNGMGTRRRPRRNEPAA